MTAKQQKKCKIFINNITTIIAKFYWYASRAYPVYPAHLLSRFPRVAIIVNYLYLNFVLSLPISLVIVIRYTCVFVILRLLLCIHVYLLFLSFHT